MSYENIMVEGTLAYEGANAVEIRTSDPTSSSIFKDVGESPL